MEKIILAIQRLVYVPAELILPMVKFIHSQAPKELKLKPFFVYLERKMTSKYTQKLSWFDSYKNQDWVDKTSNRLESYHHSLQSHLRDSRVIFI